MDLDKALFASPHGVDVEVHPSLRRTQEKNQAGETTDITRGYNDARTTCTNKRDKCIEVCRLLSQALQ